MKSYFIASLPLVFYGGTELLTYQQNNILISGLATEITVVTGYKENATRYSLQAAFIIYLWVTIASVFFLLKEILQGIGFKLFSSNLVDETEAKKRFRAWEDLLFFIGLVAVSVLVIMLMGSNAGEQRNVQNLGLDLFATALNQCHEVLGQVRPPIAGEPQRFCTLGAYTEGQPPAGFYMYVNGIIYLAAIGVAACSLGCASAIRLDDATLKSMTRVEAFRLPTLFLHLASAVFTGAMLCVYVWSGWPVPILSDVDQREAYRSLQNAIALFWGAGFSLVILSFYLPTVIIMNQRIANIPDAKASVVDGPGVPKQSVQVLERSLAILAPVVTALISSAAATIIDGFSGTAG